MQDSKEEDYAYQVSFNFDLFFKILFNLQHFYDFL